LLAACWLLLPVSAAAGSVWYVMHRGPRYDVWTWLAGGAFDGLIVGGALALVLRLVIALVDQRAGPDG
jgi:hypothetical protein